MAFLKKLSLLQFVGNKIPRLAFPNRNYGTTTRLFFDAAATAAVTSKLKELTIGYITDIEGDMDYLRRFVLHSNVLKYKSQVHPAAIARNYEEYIHLKHQLQHINPSTTSFTLPTLSLSVPQQISKENLLDDVLELQGDSSVVVFGGDACDRASGDIRLTRQLLSLRNRYPNRVFFILGNRDINKVK
jgi:hypothetical protein